MSNVNTNFNYNDLKTLTQSTANSYEKSLNEYKQALNGGDPSQIALKKIEYEKRERAFTLALNIGEKMNQLFTRIIDSLRNR